MSQSFFSKKVSPTAATNIAVDINGVQHKAFFRLVCNCSFDPFTKSIYLLVIEYFLQLAQNKEHPSLSLVRMVGALMYDLTDGLTWNKNAFQSKAYHPCKTQITKTFTTERKFIFFHLTLIFTDRIRRIGEGNVFTRGMPLAFTQEDFLVCMFDLDFLIGF